MKTIDDLIDYVEEKGISTYKLATASGYSRSYVRIIVKEGFVPKQETIDTLIGAALDVGEITVFNRHEMKLLHAKFSRSGFTLEALFGPKPESLTDREWKSFLEKLA